MSVWPLTMSVLQQLCTSTEGVHQWPVDLEKDAQEFSFAVVPQGRILDSLRVGCDVNVH